MCSSCTCSSPFVGMICTGIAWRAVNARSWGCIAVGTYEIQQFLKHLKVCSLWKSFLKSPLEISLAINEDGLEVFKLPLISEIYITYIHIKITEIRKIQKISAEIWLKILNFSKVIMSWISLSYTYHHHNQRVLGLDLRSTCPLGIADIPQSMVRYYTSQHYKAQAPRFVHYRCALHRVNDKLWTINKR